MAYGRRFEEWDRTSLLASLIHNDPMARRPFRSPESFNPFLTKGTPAETHPALTRIEDIQKLIGGTLGTVK